MDGDPSKFEQVSDKPFVLDLTPFRVGCSRHRCLVSRFTSVWTGTERKFILFSARTDSAVWFPAFTSAWTGAECKLISFLAHDYAVWSPSFTSAWIGTKRKLIISNLFIHLCVFSIGVPFLVAFCIIWLIQSQKAQLRESVLIREEPGLRHAPMPVPVPVPAQMPTSLLDS